MQDESLTGFLDALASERPTPGGGGAAAVIGATGAALVSMVCNLTAGKSAYADVEPEVRALLEDAEELRRRLLRLADEDVAAFQGVMASYRLPRASDEEKQARGAAIQEALRRATETPLACAEACSRLLRLSYAIAQKGNRNVISDAGVAALAVAAALRSAALNVYVNTGAIRDADFVEAAHRRLQEALSGSDELLEDAYRKVRHRMEGEGAG